ncbi:MAG: hypothetical protein PHD57_12310 [Desulfobacterales bacterium]|nr:hypothetical protein [Desulfobacterales bacterium]
MYYDPILFEYHQKPFRIVILDNGIHFVYRDLCRIPGFRAMTEAHVTAQPVYYRIWHPAGSARVRLLHREAVDDVLCYMRHNPKYAAGEYPFSRWLSEEVYPALYERPDCQKFIPRPPWNKKKAVTTATGKTGNRATNLNASPQTKKRSNPEKRADEETIKDMFLTQFAFMLLTGILDSMPVVFVCGDGEKENPGHDR